MCSALHRCCILTYTNWRHPAISTLNRSIWALILTFSSLVTLESKLTGIVALTEVERENHIVEANSNCSHWRSTIFYIFSNKMLYVLGNFKIWKLIICSQNCILSLLSYLGVKYSTYSKMPMIQIQGSWSSVYLYNAM